MLLDSAVWQNSKIPPHPPENLETASQYKHVFSTNESHLHTLWDCWRIHDLKLWNLVRFQSFLLSGTGKQLRSESGQISLKRGNIFDLCVESTLTFCRKEIWSFLKVLDYQILEELINLRFKCSFLSLVQVTSRVQVTPFHQLLSQKQSQKTVHF